MNNNETAYFLNDQDAAFCPPPDCYGSNDDMDKNRIFRIEWIEEEK